MKFRMINHIDRKLGICPICECDDDTDAQDFVRKPGVMVAKGLFHHTEKHNWIIELYVTDIYKCWMCERTCESIPYLNAKIFPDGRIYYEDTTSSN